MEKIAGARFKEGQERGLILLFPSNVARTELPEFCILLIATSVSKERKQRLKKQLICILLTCFYLFLIPCNTSTVFLHTFEKAVTFQSTFCSGI